jgi:hypothetical protein
VNILYSRFIQPRRKLLTLFAASRSHASSSRSHQRSILMTALLTTVASWRLKRKTVAGKTSQFALRSLQNLYALSLSH